MRITYIVSLFILLQSVSCFSQTIDREDIVSPSTTSDSRFVPEAFFSSPVYLFIDRYLSQLLSLPTKEQQVGLLREDMVSFKLNYIPLRDSKHSLSFILNLIEPTSTFILQENEKDFRCLWITSDSFNTIELVFPKQYDLILGKDKKELSRSFRSDLLAFNHTVYKDSLDLYFDSNKAIDNVFADLGDSYIIPQMRSGRYVQKKGDDYDFVLNERMGEESLLNLFTDADLMKRSNMLQLTVKGYDTSDSFEYTLDRLCAYMKEHKCKAYLGIETVDENEYTGTVFYVNRDLMYKHLFYFKFPKTAIKREQDIITIKVYPYIPINNIGDLYEDVSLELNK